MAFATSSMNTINPDNALALCIVSRSFIFFFAPACTFLSGFRTLGGSISHVKGEWLYLYSSFVSHFE